MAAALELLKFFSRKRKAKQEFLGHQYRLKEEMAKKRFHRGMEFETEASQPAVMSAIVITKSDRNERGPDELRNGNWWTDGYQNWDEESFKKRLRVSRDTFESVFKCLKTLSKVSQVSRDTFESVSKCLETLYKNVSKSLETLSKVSPTISRHL